MNHDSGPRSALRVGALEGRRWAGLVLAHPARFVLLAPAIGATWMMIRIPTLDPALLTAPESTEGDGVG